VLRAGTQAPGVLEQRQVLSEGQWAEARGVLCERANI
jgi:hypothetical protein